MRINKNKSRGASLIELLVSMAILGTIMTTMFQLLRDSQYRVTAEQDFTPVFQEVRNSVDLIIRDIHRAGYPSPFTYAATPDDPLLAPAPLQNMFSVGLVGLPTQTCLPTVTCAVPNGFDLLLEVNPDTNSVVFKDQVQWVEYRLVRPAGSQTGTLMRSMIPKASGTDPYSTAKLTPVIENVLNDPANPADAIFTYSCAPAACTKTGDINQVLVNVRVRSYHRDMQTNQYRVVTVAGLAQKMNPGY
ncbi:MAG: prepilin-type N-terminal cleavage/methylation domain-containing protein [Acidobacteriia bacterium]|nr:prepilin-type N-terminal cleavage/methylation domain-containing protein [Terriglobia bacterium]